MRRAWATLRIAAATAAVALIPAASAQAAPPANDAFAAAQQLPTPANVSGTTAEATLEPGEPDYENREQIYGQGSVWYSWTAPNTSRYVVANCGSPEERPILVYTGSSLAGLQREPEGTVRIEHGEDLGCPFGDNGKYYVIDARAGTTYRIVVVDAFQGYNGPFQLTLEEKPVSVFDSGITQTASRRSVKRGGTVTYTITLTNTGTIPIDAEWIHLIATKPRDEHKAARRVRYVSITSTRGTCKRQRYFAVHKGALCAVGRLEPGESAVVTARLKLGQSISHWVSLDYSAGGGIPEPDDQRSNDESKVITRARRR